MSNEKLKGAKCFQLRLYNWFMLCEPEPGWSLDVGEEGGFGEGYAGSEE